MTEALEILLVEDQFTVEDELNDLTVLYHAVPVLREQMDAVCENITVDDIETVVDLVAKIAADTSKSWFNPFVGPLEQYAFKERFEGKMDLAEVGTLPFLLNRELLGLVEKTLSFMSDGDLCNYTEKERVVVRKLSELKDKSGGIVEEYLREHSVVRKTTLEEQKSHSRGNFVYTVDPKIRDTMREFALGFWKNKIEEKCKQNVKITLVDNVVDAEKKLEERDYDLLVCDLGLPIGIGDLQYNIHEIEGKRMLGRVESSLLIDNLKITIPQSYQRIGWTEEEVMDMCLEQEMDESILPGVDVQAYRKRLVGLSDDRKWAAFAETTGKKMKAELEAEVKYLGEAAEMDKESPQVRGFIGRGSGCLVMETAEKKGVPYVVFTDANHWDIGTGIALVHGYVSPEEFSGVIKQNVTYSEDGAAAGKLFVKYKESVDAFAEVIDGAISNLE
jgi:hypothetical protein